MYSCKIIPKAWKELEHEIEYSKKRWGASHAARYKREILAFVRKIAKGPKLYAEKPELGEGLRSVRHKGNYVVYMLNEQEKVMTVIGFPSIHKPHA